ncbi:hypothetical protein D3C85_1539150 [compost metagenome]
MDDITRQFPQEPEHRLMVSRAIEVELESRDQERIEVTTLVEQARQQLQSVLHGTGTPDDLAAAHALLNSAINILTWPLVHGAQSTETA